MATVSVDFYKNFAKRKNSTKQPLGTDAKDTFNCYIKDNCNITEPEIEVVISGSTPLNPTNPAKIGYNYAYISEFSRYYFIQDWRYYKGTWTAFLVVDVLGSFKTGIGALTKYVSRSSNTYDGTLLDTKYPTKTSAIQTDTSISGGFSLLGGFYILGLIGGKPSGGVPTIGGVNYYHLTGTQMLAFTQYISGSTFNSLIADPAEGVTEALARMTINPIEYVASCMYFPFSIYDMPTPASYVQPLIGWWNTSPLPVNDQSEVLGGQFSSLLKTPSGMNGIEFTLPKHPQDTRGVYMDRAPYSQYLFHLDPFGDIEIPSELIDFTGTRKLYYDVQVDLITGMGRLTISNASTSPTKIYVQEFAQIGIPIQLSQISTDMTGIAAGFGKILWDGFKGVFNDTIANIGDAVITGIEAMHTKQQAKGGQGSVVAFPGSGVKAGPVLRTITLECVNEDVSEYGRPLFQAKVLNTIPGYIKCSDGDHAIACFDSERSEISNYLVGGFFYE